MDPKTCPAQVAALRTKHFSCANATDGGATARRCCYSCADRGFCRQGTQVTCEDGVLNGDEVSIDCGGSCGAPQGTACNRGFESFMSLLQFKVPGYAGVAMRRNLTEADFLRFGISRGYTIGKLQRVSVVCEASGACAMPASAPITVDGVLFAAHVQFSKFKTSAIVSPKSSNISLQKCVFKDCHVRAHQRTNRLRS
jgi:hypothetical protein